MTSTTRCDGCDRVLGTNIAVQGAVLASAPAGWPLTRGHFDWCEDCAKAAFLAVLRHNGRD